MIYLYQNMEYKMNIINFIKKIFTKQPKEPLRLLNNISEEKRKWYFAQMGEAMAQVQKEKNKHKV